ncbi:MAG: hypothetical protein Q7R92_00360 [bacterium]|nr:hypothetical protein [bacterium]
MKKILLFCSLAAFLLSAVSVLAAAAPKPAVSQRDVLKLFQTAMGNRYADLNSNAKSGAQGAYDYIIGASKITKDMANGGEIYKKTAMEQLDWFKEKFIANEGAILNQRDKDGIKNGMSNRFNDLCSAGWLAAINALTRDYRIKATDGAKAIPARGTAGSAGYKAAVPAVISFKQILDRTVKNCNNDYNKNVTCTKGVECKDKKGARIKYSNGAEIPTTNGVTAKNSQYNNSTVRYIEQEGYANERDLCTANAYIKFNQDKTAALAEFRTDKENAAPGSLGPDEKMRGCLGTRASDWWVANE